MLSPKRDANINQLRFCNKAKYKYLKYSFYADTTRKSAFFVSKSNYRFGKEPTAALLYGH